MQVSPDGRAFVIDETGHSVGSVWPSDIVRYVQLCMLQSRAVRFARTEPKIVNFVPGRTPLKRTSREGEMEGKVCRE